MGGFNIQPISERLHPHCIQVWKKWEADAATMEQYSDARGAAVCRLHLAEFKEAVRAEDEHTLTLSEAALESGYSESHLRHRISDGEIQNAGRKGSPRIRRGDLPKKMRRRRSPDGTSTRKDDERW